MRLVTILLCCALAGCTSAVSLRHPDGRVAKCGPYNAFGVRAYMAGEQERGCIEDFKQQGYQRVSE